MSELSHADAQAEARTLSVIFQAGGERYLLPAADVAKVAEIHDLNRLPRLPAAVLGITQHRGRVVTVFDLVRLLFGEGPPAPATSGPRKMVLLHGGNRNAALLVDLIEEIAPVRLSGARSVASPIITVVQFRGRAVNALRADALLQAITALSEAGAGS